MGFLASRKEIDEDSLRRAMIYGSVMASFNAKSSAQSVWTVWTIPR